MRHFSIKKILITGLILLISALAIYFVQQKVKSLTEVKAVQSDKLPELKKGFYHPSIMLNGLVEPQGRIDYKSPLAAKVKHIHVAEGDSIRPGQILLELDKRKLERELAYQQSYIAEVNAKIKQLTDIHQADMASLASEKQLLQLQERSIKRMEQLNAKHLAADAELDAVKAIKIKQQLDISKRELLIQNYQEEQAKLQTELQRYQILVQQLHEDLANSQISASQPAKVAQVLVSVGDYMNVGQPLLTAYNNVVVKATVPPAYIRFVTKKLLAQAYLNDHWVDLQLKTLQENLAYFCLADTAVPVSLGQTVTLGLILPLVHAYKVPDDALDENNKITISRRGKLQVIKVKLVGKIQNLDQPEQTESLIQSKFLQDGDILVTQ